MTIDETDQGRKYRAIAEKILKEGNEDVLKGYFSQKLKEPPKSSLPGGSTPSLPSPSHSSND